jgi:peptidoglycan/LPS O-acetylase OafA/YrhL
MKSSSDKYYPGLDHVRALAAFLVVTWHFAHSNSGTPVPYNQAPEIGLLDEGHVGVSLFMTLSGYLFAKLIAGRPIDYPAFLWNRALRLLPLLILVFIAVALLRHPTQPGAYLLYLLTQGPVFPILPNGGWSITAETHFYLVLPLLLWACAKWRWAPLALVATSICLRMAIGASGLSIQDAAYWTIIGRIDQFAFGIYFYHHRASGKIAAAAGLGILAAYALFDMAGGYYHADDRVWLVLPTIEGLALGALISWYDANPIKSPKMWIVEKAGEYSYSIYLLHFFFVFHAARLINQHVMAFDSLYGALPWAMLFFIAMTALGHASYKLVEGPPMRFRKPYIRQAAQSAFSA